MDVVLVLVVLAAVLFVIGRPLAPSRAHAREVGESADRAALESAKEHKYREIRDLEMDYRTGKLSEADWKATDRALRGEALDVLRRLDALDGAELPD